MKVTTSFEHFDKLNQPFLRITQSAYTTLSIMDEDYIVELFGGMEYPDGSFVIDHVDDIIEYEKAFMNVVRECHEQNMMTFPVISCALIANYPKDEAQKIDGGKEAFNAGDEVLKEMYEKYKKEHPDEQ